jgi:RNA polymerase sigma factor (sigma-70 family)
MADVKPYRVLAKVKNNRLWTAIREMFPGVESQSDAARLLSIAATELGALLNMKRVPGHWRQSGEFVWRATECRIADRLGHPVTYLFDLRFYAGQIPHQFAVDVGPKELPLSQIRELAPSPHVAAELSDMSQLLSSAMTRALKPREQTVLQLYYGLDGHDAHTFREIATQLGISMGRTQQIAETALQKLRHPRNNRAIRSYARD